MSYTVILNSTEYYGSAPANIGSIQYAVDWSFMPKGKQYKVSFNFIVGTGSLSLNMFLIYADFTGSPLVYEGGSTIQKDVSNCLGIAYTGLGSTTTTISNYRVLAHENDPIVINDRPSNNVFTVRLVNVLGNLTSISRAYQLILTFTEIE